MAFPVSREVQNQFAIASHHQIVQYLDTNGDGTGTVDMVGNYAGSPTAFKIVAPAGQQYTLTSMVFQTWDTGAFAPGSYGASGAPLTNGLVVGIYDDQGNPIVTLPRTIKRGADWQGLTGETPPVIFGGGDSTQTFTWVFAGRGGSPIVLEPGESFRIIANDNLTFLVGHTAFIRGYWLHTEAG